MKTIKLNKALLSTIMATAAIATSSVYAHNSKADAQFYVGADAMYSKLGFKQDYGKEIFSKKFAPGINLFAGHMFNENFGMELGWEMYKKMKRSARVDSNKKAAGGLVDPTLYEWKSFDTTLKQNYPYLGAIAKMSIINDNIFAKILLGVSVPTIKAQYNSNLNNLGPDSEVRTFSKTKLIPIARVALEYKITSNFGLQALGTWKNTSQFKAKSKENSAGNTEVKFKDTFSIGLGATYYI